MTQSKGANIVKELETIWRLLNMVLFVIAFSGP